MNMLPSQTTDDALWLSLAWEKATGADSIATIQRVYHRRKSGAIECIYPGCEFARKDPEKVWRHVHGAHGEPSLPPDDFDMAPWLR